MNIICTTHRLVIKRFTKNDAAFILRLLNEEAFIQNIADKQVRNLQDAKNYLTNGPISSYQNYGFGLNLVMLKETKIPIGICGLLKREELDYPDLGYALLTQFCGNGYAHEAASAVLQHEISDHQLTTIIAVTSPDNNKSNGLLKKLGFHYMKKVELYGLENNMYQYLTSMAE